MLARTISRFTLATQCAGSIVPDRCLHFSVLAKALDEQTKKRISQYVKSDPVVVFMKGTKAEPMCGFSKNVKLVLEHHRVDFKDYNVLEDEELRQGIKEYSDWPTIPQIYVKGNFVGGSDIIVQMHKDGEITDFFDEQGITSRYSEKNPKND